MKLTVKYKLAVALAGISALILLALAVGRIHGGTLILTDANCVQTGAVPGQIPFAIDPAKIKGAILSPYPGDFTRWDVPAGKFNRVGQYCDEQGHEIAVEIISAPPDFAVTIDPANKTWTLAGTLSIGPHYIVVRAVDKPAYSEPMERVVTVIVDARPAPNQGPVLY